MLWNFLQRKICYLVAIAAIYPALSFMPLVWAANGVLESIFFNPQNGSIILKNNSDQVQATMSMLNIGGGQRVILDLRNAEVGVGLPRDPLLLHELSAKYPGIRNISVNQFGGAEPVVRVLLDIAGNGSSLQLVQDRGKQVELRLPPVATAQTVPVKPAVPEQPVRINIVQTPTVAPAAVDPQAYHNALRTVEEQKKLLAKLQEQLFQARTETPVAPVESPELAALRSKLAGATQTINSQNQEIAQLKGRISAAAKNVAPQQPSPSDSAALATLKNQLAEAQKALTGSVQTVNAQNQEIAQLKSRISDTRIGLDTASKEQISLLNTRLDEKENQLRTQEQQLTALKIQLVELKKASPAVNGPNASQAELKKQLDEVSTQYRTAVAESNRQQQAAAEKLAKAEANAQQVDTLSRQVSSLQEELRVANLRNEEALKGYNSRLQGVQGLEQTLQGKVARIQELEGQLTELQQKHQQALEAAEQASATLNQDNKTLRAQITVLNEASANATRSDALAAENAQLKADLKTLSEALTKAEADKLAREQAQSKDLEGVRQEIAAKSADLDKLRQDNTALQAQLSALKDAQDKAQAIRQAGLENLQSENSTLKTELERLQKELAAAQLQGNQAERQQNALKNLETVNASLQTQVVKLQDELTALKQKKTSSATQPEVAKNVEAATASLKEQLALLKGQLQEAQEASQQQLVALADRDEQIKKLSSLEQPATGEAQPVAAKQGAELKQLQGQIKRLEEQLAEARERVTKSASESDRLRLELKSERSRKNPSPATGGELAQQARFDKLQGELDEANRRYEQSVKEASRLRAELARQPHVPGAKSPVVANNPEAEKQFRLGKDAETNGQQSAALQAYAQAYALAPNNAQYVFSYSTALAEQREYAKAIQNLQAYLEKNPYDRDAYNQIGKIYLLNNQTEDAKNAFRHAMPVSILNNYATAMKRQGKMDEAERFFKLALELNPTDSDVFFNLGNLYNTANNLEQAKSSYLEALKLRPDFAEAHYNLGLLLSKLGDSANAVDHLERFLQLSPTARNAEAIRNYVKKLKG